MDEHEKEQKVIRAAETIKNYCEERACGFCVFWVSDDELPSCSLGQTPEDWGRGLIIE